ASFTFWKHRLEPRRTPQPLSSTMTMLCAAHFSWFFLRNNKNMKSKQHVSAKKAIVTLRQQQGKSAFFQFPTCI
ncbi:MAG: hypothetical protein IJ354_10845, partial [Clostridia bacterium]|nr:hypothetical protein [Clostridia bacterium]